MTQDFDKQKSNLEHGNPFVEAVFLGTQEFFGNAVCNGWKYIFLNNSFLCVALF